MFEEEGTYLHMIWECSLVHPFWCKILAILEEWMGSNLPVEPRLCLLGDKSMIPNIEKNKFTLIKIGCITAARMILRNWKIFKRLLFNLVLYLCCHVHIFCCQK